MTASHYPDIPHSVALDAVKLDEAALKSLLDWMDAQERTPEAALRQHKRHAYHCKGLIVTIDQGGYQSTCAVPIRNISNGGIAFLHRAMVHVGRPCKLQIRTPDNRWIHTTGKVVRTRYVRRGIYEIGLCFDREIDSTQFKDASQPSAASNAPKGSGGPRAGSS